MDRLIELPHFGDERGLISVLEEDQALPFRPKRLFFIHDVPSDQARGEHANRETEFMMVAIKGSVAVEVHDGKAKKEYLLDDPTKALYLEKGVWKIMKNFTKDAVLLVVASTKYDKSEYITDYKEFLAENN